MKVKCVNCDHKPVRERLKIKESQIVQEIKQPEIADNPTKVTFREYNADKDPANPILSAWISIHKVVGGKLDDGRTTFERETLALCGNCGSACLVKTG